MADNNQEKEFKDIHKETTEVLVEMSVPPEKENFIDVVENLNHEADKGKFILNDQRRKNMHVLEVVEANPPELKEAEINESTIMGKGRDAANNYKNEIEALQKDISSEIINNDKNMENIEMSPQSLKREEIIGKIEKINKRIESESKTGAKTEDINSLNLEREVLLNLLDQGKGDFGNEISKKEIIKNDVPNSNVDAENEKKDQEAILKELRDKDSLLFKTKQKIENIEEHIEKLEKGLKELEKMKESKQRASAIEIHNASLKSEKEKLEKAEEKVRKILAYLKEKK